MAGNQRPRVVVTGVGVVSPIGIGSDAFWKSLISGQSGIDYLQSIPTENLPTKVAAEVKNFDPLDFVSQSKLLKVMSRDIQLGVSASSLAMSDAKLKQGDVTPERLGVVFGAGRISVTPEEFAGAVQSCSATDHSFQFTRWGEDSMGQVAPLSLLRRMPNMPACHVSIEYDARGPSNTITSRDSSALLALSEAVNVIQRGSADCMIVGACSSNVNPVDISKLSLFDEISLKSDDPRHACRPFDFRRNGAILGEGAATFVVERYEHARRRGAEIYAEIIGVGSGCDGRGFANGAGGTGLVHAIKNALSSAKIRPQELGHINAHGKSTQRDDLVEARAYHRALGDQAENIPVTALTSYFGHFEAGAGAVELAGSLLSLKHGLIPPTLNYKIPDPRCRLNIVHEEPASQKISTAISVNRTAMGQSAAAIIRAI